MTEKELQFHLALMELPIQDRVYFPARLDITAFKIPELSAAFEEVRRLINDVWSSNLHRLSSPSGQVFLHLDYIASPHVNAITFGKQGTYFVGLSEGMLLHFV